MIADNDYNNNNNKGSVITDNLSLFVAHNYVQFVFVI